MLRRKFTLEEKLHLVIVASKVQVRIDQELGDALLAIADGDDAAFARVHDRLNVLGRFDGADRIRKLVAPLFTHVGFSRYTGYIHRPKLYGHAVYHGKIHALNADCAASIFEGKSYAALCGQSVVADSDFDGRFNLWASQDGVEVTCKRCAKIIRKES